MAVGVFLASFPVYRVYVDRFPLTSNDAQMVEAGFQKAETRCPVLEKEFRVLSKSLRPLPVVKEAEGKVFDQVTDPEYRYRQRYVDLIVNPKSRDTFFEAHEAH